MSIASSSVVPQRGHPASRATHLLWVASLLMSVALVALPFIFRLDGKPHADWQQFLGRFHPIMVHLPIGLILLVPLLELAGRFRPALAEAAAFVLPLCVPACLAAVTLGYLLAYGSGQTGGLVTRHMWGGIALTIAVTLCVIVRPWFDLSAGRALVAGQPVAARRPLVAGQTLHRAPALAYPSLLAIVVLLLSWAAHQGGSITHGDRYLTEFLPAPLKPLLGAQAATGGADLVAGSFYAVHIHPVLDQNCVGCHGDGNVKGGLRLDSYAQLMKGGAEGPSVIPGQPEKSLLFQRITLPTDHKKFMPSEGKPPLKAEQILWIKTWIAQGASPTLSTLAGLALPIQPVDAPLQPVGDYHALLAEMTQTAADAGVTIMAVSRNPSDGLILNTVDTAPTFTDAQLTKFAKFAPYIVEAELARTPLTDASLDTLAKFTHLRALHLEGTAITGAGLAKLVPLSQLSYLNLSETKVTEAALKPLTSMKTLHHLYLFNTPAQPMAIAPPEKPVTRKT